MDKRFMDGPVSGGQAGAENGALTIMLGGDQETFDTAAPVRGETRLGDGRHGYNRRF